MSNILLIENLMVDDCLSVKYQSLKESFQLLHWELCLAKNEFDS